MKRLFIAFSFLLLFTVVGVASSQVVDSLYTYHIVLVNTTDEDFYGSIPLDLSSKDLIDSAYMDTDLLNFKLRNDEDISERFSVMPGGSLMNINYLAFDSVSDTAVVTDNLTRTTLPSLSFSHNDLQFYFGLGSNNQFFSLFFNIDAQHILLTTDPVVSFTFKKWQYWNGSSWSDLTTNRNNDEIISSTGVYSLIFDNPGDWSNTSPPYGSGNVYWIRAVIENTSRPNRFVIDRPQYESSEWWIHADVTAHSQEFLTIFFPNNRDGTDNSNSNQLIFNTASSTNLPSNILTPPWVIYLDVNLDTINCEANVDATIIRIREISQLIDRLELLCNQIDTNSELTPSDFVDFEDFFFNSFERYKIAIVTSQPNIFGFYNIFLFANNFISEPVDGPHNVSSLLQLQFPSICINNICEGQPSAVKSLNDFRFYRNYSKSRFYSNRLGLLGRSWTSSEIIFNDVVLDNNRIEIEDTSEKGDIIITLDSISFPTPADLRKSILRPKFTNNEEGNYKLEIKTTNTEWIDITEGSEKLVFDESITENGDVTESVQIKLSLMRDSEENSPILDSFFLIYLDNQSYNYIPVTGEFTGDLEIRHIDTNVKLGDFNLTVPKNTPGIFSSVSSLSVNREDKSILVDNEEMIQIKAEIDRVSFLDGLPLGGIIFLLHKKSGLPIPVVWALLLMFFTLFIGYYVVKFFGETILYVVITLFMLTTLAMSTSITDIFAIIIFIVAGLVLLISNREIVRAP